MENTSQAQPSFPVIDFNRMMSFIALVMQIPRHYKPSIQYNLAIAQFQSFHLSICIYFQHNYIGYRDSLLTVEYKPFPYPMITNLYNYYYL